MFSRLFWRYIICPRFLSSHTRDWYAWDSMGLSRCMHCRSSMPEPSIARRHRL